MIPRKQRYDVSSPTRFESDHNSHPAMISTAPAANINVWALPTIRAIHGARYHKRLIVPEHPFGQKVFGWLDTSCTAFGLIRTAVSANRRMPDYNGCLNRCCSCESGTAPPLRNTRAVHSLSDERNERNNAALHKAEIAVPSHKAAEIE
jgi:hypothetical protein